MVGLKRVTESNFSLKGSPDGHWIHLVKEYNEQTAIRSTI